MRDLFAEIWESIRRNKLRTCLTGLAVSWGIFMLIVLLGTGNGIKNSFNRGSGRYATNSMQVRGGWTSNAYDGLDAGRRIRLDNQDLEVTRSDIFKSNIDEVSATVSTSGTLVYGSRNTPGSVQGGFPERLSMEKIEIKYGRFINSNDIALKRKVLVLPESTAEKLLPPGRSVKSLIGEYVKLGNIFFRVVGLTRSDRSNNDNTVHAPYTTIRAIYAKGKYIDNINFTFHGLPTEEANEAFENHYRSVLNSRHRADPKDKSAIFLRNRFMQNMQMEKGGRIITIFLWIVGLFTLLGGIVGVGNIMLITVKERTHEFGIRKSLGARPGNILSLILAESVSITAVFGYVGMVLGILACELLDKTLGQSKVDLFGSKVAMLVNPTVGIDIAIGATVVLIVAGTIAGLMPAMKAAKVKPIEALRAE